MTTNPSTARPLPLSRASRWTVPLAGSVLVAAGLVAYHNSFSVPFVFDDLPAIRDNTTIRELSSALSPPRASGLPVSGRPVVNFSLALNYALGGPGVAGFHALNLALHLGAALALFGIVRRTLLQPLLRESFGGAATRLALMTALLWTLHPLQTESVTYVVQRAESLMGLFFLLTLYAFIRGVQDGASHVWHGAAVAACALGMASKEVMVSAPLLVLLYDRTFASGSFREAWRRNRIVHSGLAATWLLLGWLVLGSEGRGGTAGFGTGVAWWSYAAAQFPAIVRYLAVTFWPPALTLDYGDNVTTQLGVIVPSAILVVALVAATVFALWRKPVIGFLGAWFFAILAPTSSVVPIATQTMAEHRMYLPLATLALLAALAVHRWMGRWSAVAVPVVAAGLALLTIERNDDYRSAVAIWRDTVGKRPENPRAHCNLGDALFLAGDPAGAMAHYTEALRLRPDYGEAHYNLANALLATGRAPEAAPHYEAAIRLQPRFAKGHRNLAHALAASGRAAEALTHFGRAAELEAGSAEIECGWADALTQLGRGGEAIGHYEAALRAQPNYPEAHNNLANALMESGRAPEAVTHYEAALRARPEYPEAHNNLGQALASAGDFGAARQHFEAAVRLRPDYAAARENIERLRAMGH